jgi:hypothetical protein
VIFRLRTVAIGSLLAVSMLAGGTWDPVAAAGIDTNSAPLLAAYLDGKPIPLADVSRYYCDDFSYPIIRCSTSQLVIDVRATLSSMLASVDYVTIYENTNFQGGAMNVSQDYNVLAWIGWNDRISSFKARNSETGTFFTDWLYGGSQWSFCCNSQLGSLGGYDNTFSSVKRT